MEQKIYSRAAAKTSLSDLVIDQQNPERSFTRRELDLLRVEGECFTCCLLLHSSIMATFILIALHSATIWISSVSKILGCVVSVASMMFCSVNK